MKASFCRPPSPPCEPICSSNGATSPESGSNTLTITRSPHSAMASTRRSPSAAVGPNDASGSLPSTRPSVRSVLPPAPRTTGPRPVVRTMTSPMPGCRTSPSTRPGYAASIVSLVARHGRECDLREVPRRGDDDVRRLLGVVRSTGTAPERRARHRTRHTVNARRFRQERAEPPPMLDVCGRALHLGVLAGEVLDERFERLAIALREHRAGTLPMVGEHDKAIQPRRVHGGHLDDPDDLVEATYRVARLDTLGTGVVRDLVVVDEVDIDRGRVSPHLLDHERGAQMAQQHVRRRARERIGKATRPA